MPPSLVQSADPVIDDASAVGAAAAAATETEWPVVALTTRSLPFSALRDEDLVDEHDPACRTVGGLLQVMRECYGEGLFSQCNVDGNVDEIVTLCTFEAPVTAS